jgi:hypothetical protein
MSAPRGHLPIIERAKAILLRPGTDSPNTQAIIAIGIIIGIGAVLLLVALARGIGHAPPDSSSGRVSLPGGGVADMNALEEATKRLEYITKQMEAAGAKQMEAAGQPTEQSAEDAPPTLPAITAQQLKAFLPESLPNGYVRAKTSASSGGAAGFTFVNAEASYTKDNASLDLSLSDFGAVGALASLGGIFGAHADEETETSYSKFGEVNGRMTMESYDEASESGSYSVLVGNRVLVAAKGQRATMAELKAAVDAVDTARIETVVNAP